MVVQADGDNDEGQAVDAREARLAELESRSIRTFMNTVTHILEPEKLEEEQASNQDLQNKLKAQQDNAEKALQVADKEDSDEGSIPRPHGSSGSGFSIQVAMGLATSDKKKAIYTGIQVSSPEIVVAWIGTYQENFQHQFLSALSARSCP